MEESPLFLVKKEKDFEEIKKLGNGTYGTVYLMRYKNTGVNYAVKFFDLDLSFHADFEVETLMSIKHPCIVKFHSIILHPDSSYSFSMEYAPNGTVKDKLINHSLTPTDKSIIAIGIAYGLKELHQRGILHLDLKPLNVLLNKKNQPLLCDFGLSFKPDQLIEMVKLGQVPGSYPYIAPEMFDLEDESKISSKVDIFAFGIILYNLLTEHQMFSKKMNLNIDNSSIKFNYKNDIRPDLDEYKRDNGGIVELIEKCWASDPSERPTIEYIIGHLSKIESTFNGTDSDALFQYIKEIEACEEENKTNPITAEEMNTRIEELEQASLEVARGEVNEQEKSRSSVHITFSKRHSHGSSEIECKNQTELIQNKISEFFNKEKLNESELEKAKSFFQTHRNILNATNSFLIAEKFYAQKSDTCFEFYEIAIELGSDEAAAKIQRFLKMKNVHITLDQFVRYSIQNAESLNENNIYEVDYEEELNSLFIAKNYINCELVYSIKNKLQQIAKNKAESKNDLSDASSSIDSYTYSIDNDDTRSIEGENLTEVEFESEQEIESRYDDLIERLVSKKYQIERYKFHNKTDSEISEEGYKRRALKGCPTSAAFLARPLLTKINKNATNTKKDLEVHAEYFRYVELSVVNGNRDYIQKMIDLLSKGKHNKKDINRSKRLEFMRELINKKKPFCRSPLFKYEEMVFDEIKVTQKVEKNIKLTTKNSKVDDDDYYSDYDYDDDDN